MAGLAERDLKAERMDNPRLDPELHRLALRGLERINRVSLAAGRFWRELSGLARARPGLRVLDLASGAGDLSIGLWRRVCRAGLDVILHGCDLNPRAVAFARERAAAAGAPVEFFECDVLEGGFPDGYDLYTCALFLHHLEEDDVVALLRNMSRGRALLVSDLVRSPAGYYAAWIGSRLLSGSDVVHDDAPRSVRNAFTRDEMADLARRAGLTGATVRASWPFRMLVSWRRT